MEQIAGAQGELESNIEVLRRAAVAGGDAGALGQAEAQMQALTRLQHKIGRADPSTLAAIRAEVVASVAASVALTQTARTSAANAQTTEVALHAAQAEARKVVDDFTHDFYERKIFEGDLKFTSPDDERAYREREEQRRREIEKARAEGTPDGDLRATSLAIAQLEDAGAHGAKANAAYQPTLDGLQSARRDLAARISPPKAITPPPPTTEASTPIDADLIASLRAAGVVVADQQQQGHGVAPRDTAAATRGLA